MTTLADDLLKTRPIADLRVLIKQLNKDAEDKKTDLRSMVGSQYHQFIQSADKISEMHDQSKVLLSSLELFWDKNQEFVGQMQTFLNKDAQKQQQLQDKAVKNVGKQGKVSISDVNSTELWKDIGDCDLYNASIRLILASAVLVKHAPGATNGTFLISYLNEQAQNNIAALEISERDILNFKSCVFLKDTVMDDARMICNGGAEDIYTEGILEEKAKTFAVLQTLRQLSGNEDGPLDLLDMFLTNASSQLEQLFEKHLVFSNKSESIEFGMLSLIRFLQQLVLDVHVLFFEPLSVAGEQSAHFHHGLIQYFLASLQREVHVKLAAASSDILATEMTITTANLPENLNKVRAWLKHHLKMVTDRASAILSSLASAAQVAQLQQHVFAACTSPLLLASASAGTSCVHASTMEKLNISWVKVWVEANQLFFTTATPSAQVLKRLSSRPMEVEKRSKGTGKPEVAEDITAEVVDTNLLLWTRVFRVSFLHQVERLLQKACEDIFQDISTAIQTTVAQQFGLQIVFSPSITGVQSGVDTSGTHILPLKMVLKPLLDVSSTDNNGNTTNWTLRLTQGLSSSELCLLAERIRHRLDSQLLTLLDDVITPVQQQEQQQQQSTTANTSSAALSGTALMEALQANCCRLLGQLSAFLRQILEQLRLQLPVTHAASLLGVPVTHKANSEAPLFVQCLYQHFLSSTTASNSAKLPSSLSSEFHGIASEDTTSSTNVSPANGVSVEYVTQRMMSLSALFVGRLAWLLRTHEHARFTRSSLLFSSSNTTSNTASIAHTTSSVLRVSEEQCRSAFEISDTDGDGVIHLYEAIDALRALCVGDREADILRLFHAHHQHQHHSQQNTPYKHALTGDEDDDDSDVERLVSSTEKKETVLDGDAVDESMSHNVSFVRHSTQIIPTSLYHAPSLTELHNVTYEEFLLICGPALQVSGQELQCLTRFHRALDHLIVLSHMLYLSATLTSPRLTQMCRQMGEEIGLGHSRLTWRVHELELEQGASESIWLPAHMTSALATYLQDTSIQVNQDVTSADSLMSIASDVLFPVKDSSVSKSQEVDIDGEDDFDLPMLSSLSGLLTPLPSVSKLNKTNNVKNNTDDLVTTMSKTVSLHRFIQRWSREVQSQLLLDVYQIWVRGILAKTRPQTISAEQKENMSLLNQEEIRLFGSSLVTTASTKAQQQQVLEDACMQTMVDVRVLRMLTNHAALKLGSQDGSSMTEDDAVHRQYVQLTEDVEGLMDPITLELTESLVTEECVPRIVDQSRLFTLLAAPGHVLYQQKPSATQTMTTMAAVGQERHTTDALLSQLFADGSHSNNNTTHMPRLALLPTALPTGSSPKPPTNNTTTTSTSGAATVKPLQPTSAQTSNSKPVSSGVKWW